MELNTAEIREGQRKVWSSGDWPDVAKFIQSVADDLVASTDISAGLDVLDIGTGSGNVAIAAAAQGASVTGVDITTELFDAARARAKDEGVELELLEGPAAALPVEDASFDRVLSVFGAMFDPDHKKAAQEMARVVKPGGLIANAAWTPESTNGTMFRTIGEMMPPPPEGFQPPILWGDESHVRELFDGEDVEVSFERKMAHMDSPDHKFESGEEWLAYAEENLGPVVMAKAALSEQGKWDELSDKLVALFAEQETDEGYIAESEYLVTNARKPG